jgi:site-specific DNA-methyltransferase (adenine-specific)
MEINNKVYLGDCLDIMKDIPNKSIDFILCDLPFGVTAPKWDKIIDMNLLWKEYNRIIKDDGTIALFSTQPFTTYLICSNLKKYRYSWYWIKNQATNFFHAKRMPLRKVEEICIFNKGKYIPQKSTGHIPTNSAKGCSNGVAYHGDNIRNYEGGSTERFPTNVLEYDCVDNYSRLHSSEKPIKLLEYLIKTYTFENDLVLDNCAGSGSTGEACINTCRKYLLIEKELENYDIINKRLYG